MALGPFYRVVLVLVLVLVLGRSLRVLPW